jgi:DNA-binding transcriptional ArsR family regulator
MPAVRRKKTKSASLAQVLQALSDPVRLRIVRLATEGELACNQFGLKLPKATLSHHFKVLHQAGVIRARIEGTRHMTSVNREELDKRFPGLLDAVLRGS